MAMGDRPLQMSDLWGALSQLGLPAPQDLLAELQRLNANLEHLSPDLARLAQAGPALTQLAQALQSRSPEEIRELTQALQSVARLGSELQPVLDLLHKIQR
jgi:prefoldin subunit 5